MIKNILFDLDGTLINIDQEGFNKEYVYQVSNYFVKYGYDRATSIKCLWDGLIAAIKNDGSKTNEEVFSNYLGSTLGIDRNALEKIFSDFTKNEYDTLSKYIKKVDYACEAIKLLKDKKYNMILATNSLFPYETIKKRAKWGNIDIDDFSFVTTIENMNYSKPNVNYYKQILEVNNLKAEECMMFGNDLVEDLVIEKLGINCFIITDNMVNSEYLVNSKLNGSYKEFYKYIENNL